MATSKQDVKRKILTLSLPIHILQIHIARTVMKIIGPALIWSVPFPQSHQWLCHLLNGMDSEYIWLGKYTVSSKACSLTASVELYHPITCNCISWNTPHLSWPVSQIINGECRRLWRWKQDTMKIRCYRKTATTKN